MAMDSDYYCDEHRNKYPKEDSDEYRKVKKRLEEENVKSSREQNSLCAYCAYKLGYEDGLKKNQLP